LTACSSSRPSQRDPTKTGTLPRRPVRLVGWPTPQLLDAAQSKTQRAHGAQEARVGLQERVRGRARAQKRQGHGSGISLAGRVHGRGGALLPDPSQVIWSISRKFEC